MPAGENGLLPDVLLQSRTECDVDRVHETGHTLPGFAKPP